MPHRPVQVDSVRTALPVVLAWRYGSEDAGLRSLYENAKRDQWDASVDLDWSLAVEPEAENLPDVHIPIYGSPIWQRLSDRDRARLRREQMAWLLSQFLHGEQGALLTTAQLVDAVPGIDAKLYTATQLLDEARHVEACERYLRTKLERIYPIDRSLKSLFDQILADPRWDMKCLGMQLLVEGLTLAASGLIRSYAREPLIRDLTSQIMRDESRHVAFSVVSLRDFYRDHLAPRALRERQEFIYETCVLMHDRFLTCEVWDRLGLPADQCRRYAVEATGAIEFRRTVFSKIVPNVRKLGLLDGWLCRRFAELDILEHARFGMSDQDLREFQPVARAVS